MWGTWAGDSSADISLCTLAESRCHCPAPPRAGFADPGKSIAPVCAQKRGGDREGLRHRGDGEGAGGPQECGERQQSHVVEEGLDGGDPEAFISLLGGSGRFPPRMQPQSAPEPTGNPQRLCLMQITR